jgi:hypothetical protein
MNTAFIQLTWATIENIVMERFGSKAARIFRCVLFFWRIMIRLIYSMSNNKFQHRYHLLAPGRKHMTCCLVLRTFTNMSQVPLHKNMGWNLPKEVLPKELSKFLLVYSFTSLVWGFFL